MKWILLGIIILGNSCGDVLNTMGMKRQGEVERLNARGVATLLRRIVRNRFVLLGIGCLAVSFFAMLGLLSITNVSFAVPATAASYLLETTLAKYLLKEDVHWRRWAGAALAACGVLLISLQ